MGGGGASQSEYPTYLKDVHKKWIRGDETSEDIPAAGESVMGLILPIIRDDTLNPYRDPDTGEPQTLPAVTDNITTMRGRFDDFESLLDAIDSDADLAALYDASGTIFENLNKAYDMSQDPFTGGADPITEIVNIGDASEAALTSMMGMLFDDINDGVGAQVTAAIADAIGAVNNDLIEDLTEAYTTKLDTQIKKSTSRFAQSMAMQGANNSSAFILGLASIERERIDKVAEFNAQQLISLYKDTLTQVLTSQQQMTQAKANMVISIYDKQMSAWLNNRMNRNQAYMQAISQYIQLQTFKVSETGRRGSMQSETDRIQIIAERERYLDNVDMHANAINFNLDNYQKATGVLAGIAGASPVAKGPTRLQSALSGALSGAAAGAQIGGPVGAGIGAIIGGVMGHNS